MDKALDQTSRALERRYAAEGGLISQVLLRQTVRKGGREGGREGKEGGLRVVTGNVGGGKAFSLPRGLDCSLFSTNLQGALVEVARPRRRLQPTGEDATPVTEEDIFNVRAMDSQA